MIREGEPWDLPTRHERRRANGSVTRWSWRAPASQRHEHHPEQGDPTCSASRRASPRSPSSRFGAGGTTAVAAGPTHVAPQPTLKAGQFSPVRIPGTKVHKGTKLRAGQVLVSTKVRVVDNETVRFTLRCPATKVLSGLGQSERDNAGFNLDQRTLYRGRHSVKLRIDASDKKLPVAHATIYGLCHR
ncbi:MAG: hypothetical protein QOE31_2792 [Solirubrobacteraceae bacterium]|nr:hypothetical protein [Solirubrobacteraceae bacterium]